MKYTNLADWLTYQESTHIKEIDLGLERLREVLPKLPSLAKVSSSFTEQEAQNPKNTTQIEESANAKPKIITVAGTNGKGTTCAFLQNLFLSHGLSTGVYTSPHIEHYSERFSINGQAVQENLLLEAFDEIDRNKGATSLTYFEWSTLAAFIIFAKLELDIWILEVGLGGRLDATNLANADIAIITSIGKDHEEYLGTSLNAIGREKAGIFRAGQTAIFSSRLMPFSIEQEAEKFGVHLLRAGRDFVFRENVYQFLWQGINRQGEQIEFNLPKINIPNVNAAGALQAFCILMSDWEESLVADAVRDTQLAGRMQKIDKFTLDVAHNPPAMVHLLSLLKEDTKKIAIVGMLSDKDISNSLRLLAKAVDKFYLISLPTPRGTSKEAMLAYGLKAGIAKDRMQIFNDMAEAIQSVKDEIRNNRADEALILGSFVTVNLALEVLEQKK